MAATTEAAVLAERRRSRTMTRSYSSRSSSVHSTWCTASSVRARNRSMTAKGKSTLVSTKTRRTDQ